MLDDPEEIKIISRARQKNVRDHTRSRKHFEHIFEDFFDGVDLTGSKILDLGPGHFDFGVLAKERGAITHGIDNDPAVIELGNYKGFPVVDGRLQDLRADDWSEPFEGVFCKFSINAFWFWDDHKRLRDHVDEVAALLSSDGWGWIAPWNGVPKAAELSKTQIDDTLAVQREAFVAHGFVAFELDEMHAVRYGVTGATANQALFTRRLTNPSSLEERRLFP